MPMAEKSQSAFYTKFRKILRQFNSLAVGDNLVVIRRFRHDEGNGGFQNLEREIGHIFTLAVHVNRGGVLADNLHFFAAQKVGKIPGKVFPALIFPDKAGKL